MNRSTLLAAAIVSIPSSVFAQTWESVSARPISQIESSESVRITLEMRWLGLNDNFIERIGVREWKEELPKAGSHAIYDRQTAELLLQMATGDKRSSVDQMPAVTVLSGETHELAPRKPSTAVQGNDAIQATLLDDRKAVQIQLTWAKQTDEKGRLPATTATVPVGLHLLVRTADQVTEGRNEYFPPPSSYWEQLKGRLFNWKPKAVVAIGRERQSVFLLITPRVASQEREQERVK